MHANHLTDRISSKKATVGIIGMGYVGLPLALRFVEEGFTCLGFDIDQSKVRQINAGQSYIKHIPSELITEAIMTGLEATTDFSRAVEMDAIIICVPTPLSKYREPDLSYIETSVDSVLPHLRKGQIVSLESTTYPGTTEEVLKPRLESRGFVIGDDIFLVFSPEREDPGNLNFSTRTIPKIVGGMTKNCLEMGMALYGKVIDRIVPVSCTRTAEMTKLLENTHRAVNIGLVNEMKMIASKMGIDIHEVIAAAGTKPFGFTSYSPGPGLGGHCIPIDPFYLSWKAREYGINSRFIELAGEVNESMPQYVITMLTDALNERNKSLRGSKVLVLGLSYKKNVDDVRESPSLRLMEILRAKGAVIAYSDPYVKSFPKMREHSFELDSVTLTPESLAEYDAVLISTNHDGFDYRMIQENAALIIDTRGVFMSKSENVVRA